MPRKDNHPKRRGKQVKDKDEIKLKKHETVFEGKCIDLKRFAYDVFVYSARKFHIREEKICGWTGNENDYALIDFLLEVTRVIITRQIIRRFDLHQQFKKYHESNEMGSLKSICSLFQKVIKTEIQDPKCRENIFMEVEASLCVGCELIAFLDSVKSPLYVKELAKYWFESYFHLSKKKFEKTGGLFQMYLIGVASPYAKRMDAVSDYFIQAHCLPYEDSVLNADLAENSWATSTKYDMETSSSRDREPVQSPRVGDDRVTFCPTVIKLLPAECDEVSGLDIIRRLAVPGPVTPFQNPFGPSHHKPVRGNKESSENQGNRSREDIFSSVKLGAGQLSLDSSPTKLSSMKTPGVPVVDDPTPSQSFAGAMPEDSMKQSAGLSGKQKIKSSSDTNAAQGFGRQNLDSSGLDTPMNPCLGALQVGGLLRSSARKVPKTLSKTHFEVITQQPVGGRKGISDQYGRQNREDSLSSVEKGLGQLNLDTSASKQSNQKSPIVSISNYLVPSESLPSVKPKEIPEKQSQSLTSVRPKEFSKKPRRKYKKNKPKELSSTSSEENE